MADLAGYIEYLRGDKATRYADPMNAAIQAERLKVADDLERMLDATAAPVVVGEDMVERMVESFWAEMPADERAEPEWREWAKAKMRAALTAAMAGEGNDA